MSDKTLVIRDSSTERESSAAPALTLLAVIVLWYLGVAGLLLAHVV